MSKIVLIFGGRGGIGQAVADVFERKGMTVYLTSFQNIEKNQNPRVIHCDVTKNMDVKKVISSVTPL
ncbi:MAG: SDR family NAD(P)-dependent oxidoreductase [bacterium]|nr:SDR family NAD(P)-dependent oxidoreductase [bacterium]